MTMTKHKHRKSRWFDPILTAGLIQQIQHKFYPLYAFGFDGVRGKRAQVACLDSNLIVYAIGGTVVFHNVSGEKSMRFFSSSTNIESVLWVMASPTGNLVAACEKLKTGYCQISIIDVKKLDAVHTLPGLGVGEYGCCVFSDNERIFVTACNIDEAAQVDYWDIKENRVLFSSLVPYTINKITFNPIDQENEDLALSGPSQFKFWNFKGGLKKETIVQGLNDRQDQKLTFTDHTWLADTSLALSTAEGMIFIIRDGIVQHKYMDTGNTMCLLSTGRGFYSGRGDGTLSKFTGFELAKVKMQEKESPYAEVKCITLLSGYKEISCIAMPPHGQKILFMVEGENILKVHLDVADDDDAVLGSEPDLARASELSVFRMGKINGMDACVERMLFVTCGADRMLRVWNYAKMICELTHLCDEEPHLVALSPWGHYLFAAMDRRIQVYRILGFKLHHCKDITGMKNINQIKFCPGGHLVAVANSREILLISAFTWTITATLKGHTGLVTTIAWSSDSMYLVSAGVDGAIYGWFLEESNRYLEYVIKGCVYTCLLFDPARTFILACGPKLPLRVIDTDKRLGLTHGQERNYMKEELAFRRESAGSASIPDSASSSKDLQTIDTEGPATKVINTARSSSFDSANTETASAKVSNRKTGDYLEGSWVQHKYRSSCVFEQHHEKPAVLMAGLFKKGLIITIAPEGELRMYSYPFSDDKPNLLKEVTLLTAGDTTGLCVDEDRNLIFASSAHGNIFICSVDHAILDPKPEDADEGHSHMGEAPPTPSIMQYLHDSGSDGQNILLERDEVEEMKRDLVEFKLTMAREAKDAYFKHQRQALDWACEMKEREEGFLKRIREYEVKVKILEHNLHTAIGEKETTIQSLLDAHSQTTQQLQDYFQDKLAQELERSHISRKQAQKDRTTLEKELRSKEEIYLEKIVALEKELGDADARADEKVKKVQEDCNTEIEHYKMEMEEDLLISDDELNKAMEKLTHDVAAEKKRADEIYQELCAEKRTVLTLKKTFKELDEMHITDLETIAKLNDEVADLKKLVTELDYEKRTLQKILIETEEKSQHLVHERKDQETKTIVRDFKIQQLTKKEKPLEEATISLRCQLREMESHQLGHVLEMKRQGLIIAGLKAKIQILEGEAQGIHDRLHERECYVNMFTRALCRLVQENDVNQWPHLTKKLYFSYVKDVHRMTVADNAETYAHILHQKENLEKFVAILKREINRSEARNWKDAQHYMQQNLDLLHEFSDAQRNVRRLAFLTQKLQGEVAYWKSIAARRPGDFENSRPSKTSPQLDQRSSVISSSSKSTPLTKQQRLISSASSRSTLPSRGSSTGIHARLDSAVLQDAERVREQSRSSTPVADIVKPYQHKGSVASAASLRYTFIQNRPWSTEPPREEDRAKILELSIELNSLKKELSAKDKELEQLQRAHRSSSASNYLPRSRSNSLMLGAPDDPEAAERSNGEPTNKFNPAQRLSLNSITRPSSVPEISLVARTSALWSDPNDWSIPNDMARGESSSGAAGEPPVEGVNASPITSPVSVTTPSSANDTESTTERRASPERRGSAERRPSFMIPQNRRGSVERRGSGEPTERRSSFMSPSERRASLERRASAMVSNNNTERRASTLVMTERRDNVVFVERRASAMAAERRASHFNTNAQKRASSEATERRASAIVVSERRASARLAEPRPSFTPTSAVSAPAETDENPANSTPSAVDTLSAPRTVEDIGTSSASLPAEDLESSQSGSSDDPKPSPPAG